MLQKIKMSVCEKLHTIYSWSIYFQHETLSAEFFVRGTKSNKVTSTCSLP